jgi:hypothetical protein
VTSAEAVAPVWHVGIGSGLGGLVGGYLGARLQPSLPERGLTVLLGCLAVGIAALYVTQTVAA